MPVDELDEVATEVASLFSMIWPAIGYLILLIITTFFITFLVTACCGKTFRACRVPSGWVQLMQIGMGLILFYLGFSLSFTAIGVDISGFNSGLFFAAVTLSAADMVKDFFIGIQLHVFGVLDQHETIEVPSLGITGKILVIGLFTSELLSDDATSSDNHTHNTILVPNRFLLNGSLKILWGNAYGRSSPSTPTPQNADSTKKPTEMQYSMPSTRFIEEATTESAMYSNQRSVLHQRRSPLKFSKPFVSV